MFTCTNTKNKHLKKKWKWGCSLPIRSNYPGKLILVFCHHLLFFATRSLTFEQQKEMLITPLEHNKMQENCAISRNGIWLWEGTDVVLDPGLSSSPILTDLFFFNTSPLPPHCCRFSVLKITGWGLGCLRCLNAFNFALGLVFFKISVRLSFLILLLTLSTCLPSCARSLHLQTRQSNLLLWIPEEQFRIKCNSFWSLKW